MKHEKNRFLLTYTQFPHENTRISLVSVVSSFKLLINNNLCKKKYLTRIFSFKFQSLSFEEVIVVLFFLIYDEKSYDVDAKVSKSHHSYSDFIRECW